MTGLLGSAVFFVPLAAAIILVYIALRYRPDNSYNNEPRDARVRLVIAAMGVLLCAMSTAVAAIALQPANRKAPKPAAVAWIQWGHSQTAAGLPRPAGLLARALVAAPEACPDIKIDSQPFRRMMPRDDARAAIFGTICEHSVPGSSLKVEIAGKQEGILLSQQIAAAPERIAIFGDTGCRLTYYEDQGCHPGKWPFPGIVRAIATQKPEAKLDLVVHIGDYFYREAPCERSTSPCIPGPHQDREETWRAEFFEPARALLTKAPWIFIRGNHEDCQRGGYGWTYYFGDGAAPCTISHDVAYLPFANVTFVNFDTAHAGSYDSAKVHEALAGLESFAAKLLAGRPSPVFLLTHKPTYALCKAVKAFDPAKAIPSECEPRYVRDIGGVRNILDAVSKVAGRTIVVSGDIHVFQVFDLESVTQVILGNGGALRDHDNYSAIADAATEVVVDFADERLKQGPGKDEWKKPDPRGNKIATAQVWTEFGFGILDLKEPPKIVLAMYDVDGKPKFSCDLTDAGIGKQRCR